MPKYKRETVELGGESFKIKKDSLRTQLGYNKKGETIPMKLLERIGRTSAGKTIKIKGKEVKITDLIKKRSVLAINLQKRRKPNKK
tara:strand:+ start:1026 stop:1283 length:258 start_codon:yes stop_codon:yes gene_type:complete